MTSSVSEKKPVTGENEKRVHEPLFHVIKRPAMPIWKSLLIRLGAILVALIISGLLFFILKKQNPLDLFSFLFDQMVGTSRRRWLLGYQASVLLCISLAVTPAFRMKFWNIGAEGQVLIGALCTIAVMFYLGGKIPTPLLWVLMVAAGILGGILWALPAAICKARWNTNETLFTLMMNYVAIEVVDMMVQIWVPNGSSKLAPMTDYGFPKVFNDWLLNILIVLALTVVLFIYLRFSKHGYEISVVGGSENTARYIGIPVKKVIIRTMILSGALCGVAGALLAGGEHCSITSTIVGGQGFTAIMVSWLAKFNPLIMIFTSLLIVALGIGKKTMQNKLKISNSFADIITAIVLFAFIGCEFFINYKINLNKNRKEVKA